ncbi:GlcNAc-PI de-N-acetylase [Micromonospora rhizosphaerae]|uniref:GlcNAc-PI de-N-acetylase n=1 Tax=Micromonospora rhizosphaerae TaxID=568872 RepID=A0A1C6SUH3_9ACTN|nr:PIG-L family deacetylase [Micromonospora rhizosphaerae]SCL33118.1 GlcNAc-PI de-N-acetylase [Micromonospora rhizosphaerae]
MRPSSPPATDAATTATGRSPGLAPTSARAALFLVPHPDDETLAAGVLLAGHAAAGREVHILLLTRGEKSAVKDILNGVRTSHWWGVPHDPTVEGYAALTERTLGAARYRELVAAAAALGVTEDRIHEAGLPNDGVTVEEVKAAVVATADAIGGDLGLWAPSYTVDDHPDHLAAGEAVRQLGLDDPIRWGSCRYYVLPPYWSDPRLGSVDWCWDDPMESETAARARNACRAYGSWQPQAGVFACGYHSVYAMFRQIDANPRSLTHE